MLLILFIPFFAPEIIIRYVKRKYGDREGGYRSRSWDMSIPLKLFVAISLERKSVFRIKANHNPMF